VSLDQRPRCAHAPAMVKSCCVPSAVSDLTEVLASLLERRDEFVAFTTRQLGDAAAAEEVVQASYVKATERLEQLESADAARAWFYRMLRNAALDLRRRRATEQRAAEAFAAEADTTVDPEERSPRVCRCVTKALSTLKPEYAEVLRRVEIDGAAVKDFAQEQGLQAGNAAVRVFRAREALRKKVESACGACAAGGGCLDCTCADPG
jgi:RNA polymerase sigma factor (sigma-70 family)